MLSDTRGFYMTRVLNLLQVKLGSLSSKNNLNINLRVNQLPLKSRSDFDKMLISYFG